DAPGLLEPAAAEISRIEKGRTSGVEFRDVGIGKSAAEHGLESAWRRRKGVRGGAARHMSVTGAIHCDRDALLEKASSDRDAAPAEIGGIDERGAAGVELGHVGC